MRVPPWPVRRFVIAPLVLLAEAAFLLASPLLALVALVVSPLLGGRRPLRALAIAVTFATRHMAVTIACLGLSPRNHAAHHRLLRWFVGGVYDVATRAARVELTVVESDAAESLLSRRERPLLVFSTHSGEGDSPLVLHQLVCRHERRPRIVLHEALRMDPLIDLLGSRLPNRFVDPRGGDTEVEIAAMSRGLGAEDAVLIFPEGGNFTAERRARGIQRLEQAGHHEEAAWARGMRHLQAPRPGGALAALESAPEADIVFAAHVGFPRSFGEVWRLLPADQRVELRLWHAAAADVPAGREERIDWLFGWWCTLDAWVDERVTPGPAP
jgi:1-acyl-sn-glycerol-3-phosphate acyltransferase